MSESDVQAELSADLVAAIDALLHERRIEEALRACDDALANTPDDPRLNAMRGLILVVLNRPEAAIQCAQRAIALGMEDSLPHHVLGSAHKIRSDARAALAAFETAHRFAPFNDAICLEILEAMIATDGYPAAAARFRQLDRPQSGLASLWAKLALRKFGPRSGYVAAPLMSTTAWMDWIGAPLDYSGEPETIPVEDPEMLGGPPTAPVVTRVTGYAPYVATLRNVTVFSKSNTVLTADGTALNDTAADPQYGRWITFQADDAVVERRGDAMIIDMSRFTVSEVGTAVMLCGSASEHFGHWVPEFLFKLNYLSRHPRFHDLPILVDAEMPPSHLDYLHLIVPNRRILMPKDSAVRVGELLVAGPPTFFPVHLHPDHEAPQSVHGPFSPECLRFVRDRVLAKLPPPARRRRRIYLARSDRAWRRVTNEDEVQDFLTRRGFEIVLPQELSFPQQVRLFQEAEAIVGPNGSALLNLIFAQPGTPVLVLSQPGFFAFNGFAGPMRALGFDPLFVAGQTERHGQKQADYVVPIELLAEGLAKIGVS